MKIKILLIIVLANLNLNAQEKKGTWYTPLRNKLLCMIVTSDSILLKKCDFEKNSKKYNYQMPYKIEKQVNDAFIVSISKDNNTTYNLFYIQFGTDGKCLLNIESLNRNYQSVAEAEAGIQNTVLPGLNITFLNDSKLDELRKLKNITNVSAADFNKYGKKIIDYDMQTMMYSGNQYRLTHLFRESSARMLLVEAGINPLVKGKAYDDMIAKFAEIPETKDIYNQMIGVHIPASTTNKK